MTEQKAQSILESMRQATGTTGIPAPLEESSEAFPVLVSTIISLRTRDAVTREVSRKVLKKVPDAASMVSIDRRKLEELLKPAGFFRQKAGQLKKAADIIQKQFDGRVPDNMKDLLSLPGVGRKTANFILGMVYGKPAICVDVHVHRISNRLGLVDTPSPEKTELKLQELFSPSEWNRINHIMVTFGQKICKPIKPLCGNCTFHQTCPSSSFHS